MFDLLDVLKNVSLGLLSFIAGNPLFQLLFFMLLVMCLFNLVRYLCRCS